MIIFIGQPIGYGAAAGLVAAFLPCTLATLGIAGAAAGLPTVLGVIGTILSFAGVGSILGMAINTDVSANAGSIAAGVEEIKKGKAHQKAANNIAPQNNAKPNHKYFNWKVAAVTVTLGLALGALFAFTPTMAAVVAGLIGNAGALQVGGSTAAVLANPAIIFASAAVFGMFGSLLAVKNSVVSNRLNNFYTKLLIGKLFDKAPEKTQSLNLEVSRNLPVHEIVTSPTPANDKTAAESPKKISFQQLLTSRKEAEASQVTSPSR
jgi:hypothetical protein